MSGVAKQVKFRLGDCACCQGLDHVTIYLTDGLHYTLVDRCDLKIATSLNRGWQLHRVGKISYARTSVGRHGSMKYVYLHRLLMPGVDLVDHINGDGLDNRRSSNLRSSDRSRNGLNRTRSNKNSQTGLPGVSVLPGNRKRKYVARVSVRGSVKHMGYFHTPLEAHLAWKKEMETHQ